MITLDGVHMYVSATADVGVVGRETHLAFSQRGDRVFARYAGGNVGRGWLVRTPRRTRTRVPVCATRAVGRDSRRPIGVRRGAAAATAGSASSNDLRGRRGAGQGRTCSTSSSRLPMTRDAPPPKKNAAG